MEDQEFMGACEYMKQCILERVLIRGTRREGTLQVELMAGEQDSRKAVLWHVVGDVDYRPHFVNRPKPTLRTFSGARKIGERIGEIFGVWQHSWPHRISQHDAMILGSEIINAEGRHVTRCRVVSPGSHFVLQCLVRLATQLPYIIKDGLAQYVLTRRLEGFIAAQNLKWEKLDVF